MVINQRILAILRTFLNQNNYEKLYTKQTSTAAIVCIGVSNHPLSRQAPPLPYFCKLFKPPFLGNPPYILIFREPSF